MSLNASDRDPTVDPGTDFYRFANGGWLDASPIPAGYGAWGSFEEVSTRNERVLADILGRAADDPDDELDRMLGDHFASGMDIAAIESAGLDAVQPFLDAIATLRRPEQVMELLPLLHGSGFFGLFGWDVTLDHDDATQNLLWLAQAGLGLPDRDSYTSDSAAAVELRSAYVDHVAAQLRNVGTPTADTETLAAAVLDLETRLAGLHLTAEQKRNPDLNLNRYDLEQLSSLAPSLDLPGYLRSLGAGAASTVNVQNPALFEGLAGVLSATETETIRAYLTFQVVMNVADALPPVFDDEAFAFYGRRIRGQKEQHDRLKRVIDAVTADMGEALSQRFVAATFPPTAKARAERMVDAIVDEMRRSIDTRAWMGEETRNRGHAKLDAVRVKIGYPDRWRVWTGLRVDRTTYAANRLRASQFELTRLLGKLDEPVDQAEWEMPPHTVNAYYHPTRNEIVFPAGILQPPMFDADADDAVNFGGIGTVIAHEITHGFDDQGRRFDADGAFRDWWTPADQAEFAALADQLAAQFDEYTVLDDLHVNGRLTLGENIADLGGVSLAQRAHARVSADAPPVDGLTPAQRFFIANATLWRANISDEYQRTLVLVDPHSPRPLRVLGPFSNLAAFQEAFGLPEDAPMLRAPVERIEIW